MKSFSNSLSLSDHMWHPYMSREMTNPTMWVCAQRRLRSAWAWVWSQSSLSAWRNLGSLATHWARSKDWSDWVDAQADLSVCWAHTHFVGFVMSWLIYVLNWLNSSTNIFMTAFVAYSSARYKRCVTCNSLFSCCFFFPGKPLIIHVHNNKICGFDSNIWTDWSKQIV